MRRALTVLALLVLSSAGAAGLSAQPELCPAPGQIPEPTDDPATRVWTGSVPEDADGGTLDLDVPQGRLVVSSWDRDTWRVEVPGGWDPQTRVDSDTGDGRFDLRVHARPYGGIGPDLSGSGDDRSWTVAVFVPEIGYRDAGLRAWGAPSEPLGDPADGTPSVSRSVLVAGLHADTVKVRGDHGLVELGDVAADRLDVHVQRTGVRIEDARIHEATVHAPRGTVCVQDHAGRSLDVHGQQTDVVVRDATVENASARTQQGTLDLHGVRVVNLTLSTQDGPIEARATPSADGTFDLDSQRGPIRLDVPADDDRGYDAWLTSQRGRVEHDVPGTRSWREGETVRVQTRAIEDRPIRTEVRMTSQERDVTMTGDGEVARAPAGLAPDATPPAAAASVAGLALLVYLLRSKIRIALGALYSRIGRDDVLDHDGRRRILDLVQDEPGIHFSDLKRRTDLARGTLDHHLDKLVETGHVVERKVAGYRCLFPAGTIDRGAMDAIGRLRTDNARRVLACVRQRSGLSVSELAEAADLSVSSTSYLLEKLEDAGLLTKVRKGRKVKARTTDLGDRVAAELGLDVVG